MLREQFYTSPYGLSEVLTHTSMLINEPLHQLPKIYIPPRNIYPTASQFTHQFTRPMLSLDLNTPPQAQLEVPPAFLDLRSVFSWLHASLAFLDTFDSVRLDPFSRLVCSCGLSQLPCCRGTDTSSTALSSTWPSVDSASPNQTLEPNRR